MKDRKQTVARAVNEALFDVALILATALFRTRARTLPMPGYRGLLESSPSDRTTNHASDSNTRGDKA